MFKTITDTKQAISLIYNSTSNFDWKKLLLEELETGTVYLQNRKLKVFPFLDSGDPRNQRAFPDTWYLIAHAQKGQTRAKNVSNVTKLTGQTNCLHINSDLRFVSNVFLHRKKLLRRWHNVAEGTVDIFHCSQKFNEQGITYLSWFTSDITTN